MPLPTDLDDLSTTADDNYPAAGDAVAPDLDNLLRFHSASLATERDWHRRLVWVDDTPYGAVGDGATNDVVALETAALTGKEAHMPSLTFAVESSNNSAPIDASANAAFVGSGNPTVIAFEEQSATGVSEVFRPGGDGFTLENLKVTVAKALAGVSTALLMKTRYNKYYLRRVNIDGQTVLDSGTQDRSVQVIKSHATAATNTVLVTESEFSNLARVYTRDNADTDTQTTIKVALSNFRNMWRTALTFNAPSGNIDDVAVIGNSFLTHAGVVNADVNVSGNSNAVGLAGVRGGRVIGNHVNGTYGALVHVEENTDGITVVGNTARMANALSSDAVMETLANNAGGSSVIPTHQAYLGNVLRSTDGVGSGIGIQSGVSSDGARWSLYTGNISAGFDDAFRVATSIRSVLITNNVLRGTTNGIDLARAALTVDGNLIDDATQPITVARGGLMGKVYYCNLASESAAMTSFGTSSGSSPLALTEWTWESDLFEIANGASFVDIGPMPTRMFGLFSISVTSASEHRTSVFETSYDGATVSNTSKLTYGSGDITITGPAANSGAFAIELADASGPSANCRVQVRFHGGVFII